MKRALAHPGPAGPVIVLEALHNLARVQPELATVTVTVTGRGLTKKVLLASLAACVEANPASIDPNAMLRVLTYTP
ncbi:hypothetical protein [Amycolatopsis alkalitolerans]|uniref:Uncharacterized protein n=1 Tax=Amycolatopsis alkalitolerans TaxID=2547244 RepID=A0A5C4MDQ1_9PSEU|nr:hypothetical protein [Amycolatopsis alkalitolerans]TNC29683.1 hypothetical protein FG385_01645 [Amycolatopsis alkalitolerans]